MNVIFIVRGVPVGKGRPRFSTVNGHAVAYTPEKTANYETFVKLSYQQQCAGVKFPEDVPLGVRINAYFPIPKSTSKKKRAQMESGDIMHLKKPDCDNVAKAILDSLNGIAYNDDSQVCDLTVKKFYSENPRVCITIEGVEDND